MKKRVVVFVDSGFKAKEILSQLLLDYFKDNFDISSSDIHIDKFNNLKESIDSGKKIGLPEDSLVIFDRRHYPKEKRMIRTELTKDEQIYFSSLEQVFDLSKVICEHEKIPYIIYKGEIERGKEDELRNDLYSIKPQIQARLETLSIGVL